MEKRNKITSIFKSNDPDKLLVFRSISLQNEIRFYLNPTQYFTAVECEKGCEIRLRDESDEKEEFNKKSELSIIRENLKETIKSVSITLGFLLLATIGLLYLNKIIDNLLVFLLIMNITFFITISVSVILMGSMLLTPALKSKHSAEHMMVNFLEINKRLPKNIAEVKKSSRFSPNCGCRQLIKIIVKVFILSIVSTIFAVIVSGIVSHFYSNSQTNVIVFLSIYFLGGFFIGKVITKYSTLNFIIEPITKVLTYITQCTTTTSKVKDSDIILAYSVAKQWVQVVYPEFYNGNDIDDISWKSYLKVNN